MNTKNLIFDLKEIDNPLYGLSLEKNFNKAFGFGRKFRNSFHRVWMIMALILVVSLPILIVIALVSKSNLLLQNQRLIDLLFSSEWQPLQGKFGFLPFILGSVWVSVISIVIAGILSILAAIHLSFYVKKRFLKFAQPVIDILAGIPSVVYGAWGIIFIVPLISKFIAPFFGKFSSGYCLLTGAIVLSIMIIPFILNILIELFRNIPKGLIEASYSLGSTKWDTIYYVVLRKTRPGIISAITLGISRAFGETIAVLMVIGNIIKIPDSLFASAYPIPALIANNYGEMMSIPLYDSALMFASLLLLIIVTFFNLVARYMIFNAEKRI